MRQLISGLAVLTVLAACSSGSDGPSTGPLSVQIADDPIDPTAISRVCIPFSAITLNYAGREDVRIDYVPEPTQVSDETHCVDSSLPWDGSTDVPPVRLDALSGALTVSLVDSLRVPTGRITSIRLHFVDGAYVEETQSGGTYPLECPSCEVTDNNTGRGFKLNRTFEVTSAGLSLLVDVDLRQSLLKENIDGYILRPTARVELNGMQGTIAGSVAGSVIDPIGGTTFSGSIDVDTGCAVYVFPDDGSDLDDFYYDANANVVSTAAVRYTGTEEPSYAYAAGALPVEDDGSPRSYRVALTCDLDDPAVDDVDDGTLGDGAGVSFLPAPGSVEVIAGQTTFVDFL